eukprot:TRINITY_DN5365_c0_g1_i2.p2 TRINITY_DN5365_c0_g1~~TRINITY_DN5365_c0_g1_i2.p2  ORF type:complete len:227 (+),score=62.08 TRINITY_DN5365_c0_g1_i2:297-977(+)
MSLYQSICQMASSLMDISCTESQKALKRKVFEVTTEQNLKEKNNPLKIANQSNEDSFTRKVSLKTVSCDEESLMDSKLTIKRERNKECARKCRQRRKALIGDLFSELENLEKEKQLIFSTSKEVTLHITEESQHLETSKAILTKAEAENLILKQIYINCATQFKMVFNTYPCTTEQLISLFAPLLSSIQSKKKKKKKKKKHFDKKKKKKKQKKRSKKTKKKKRYNG